MSFWGFGELKSMIFKVEAYFKKTDVLINSPKNDLYFSIVTIT